MTARLETVILKGLVKNEDYARKVLPFIKSEYFIDASDRRIYEGIHAFYGKYDATPTIDAISIDIDQDKTVNEHTSKNIKETLNVLDTNDLPTTDWLIENTEKFCQEKALYNAMMESIEIMEGKGQKNKGAIPQILQDALAVTFDPNIGHDYLEDVDLRWDYYTNPQTKIPFRINMLNQVTNGGVTTKTLNAIIGGVHVGKSAILCHLAADYLLNGKNVLYVTCELAEEEVARRIDANLLNTPMDQVATLPKNVFDQRFQALCSKISTGKLKIKEYPAGVASVIHFRALLNEYRLKSNFKPDVVLVDYINICASSRLKLGAGGIGTYGYFKSVSEEFRGFGKEFDIPVWTATQFNRTGFANSDPGMEEIAESFGITHTADLVFGAVRSEQLDNLGQIMLKQMKNRYRDMNIDNKFVLGFDRSKMRLFDVTQSGIVQTVQPTTPQSNTGFTGTKPMTKSTAGWKI